MYLIIANMWLISSVFMGWSAIVVGLIWLALGWFTDD